MNYIATTYTLKLKILQEESEKLASINKAFAKFALGRAESGERIRLATYFEEYETRRSKKSIRLIVPKESASLPFVEPLSIAADHSNMCKFQHERVNGYISASNTLCAWICDIQSSSADIGQSKVQLPRFPSTIIC